jgi:hypothetical protein
MVGFFKSSNLGQTWSQITSIPAANIRRIREIDGNIVAVTSQGTYALSLLKSNNYLWSTGDTTPTINVTPSATTKYWVRVSNGSHMCTDTVTVTVNNPPANLIAQDTIKACGDSVLVSATSGLASYSWSNGKTTSSIYAKNGGWYKVTGANAPGCSATDSVFVSILKANILNDDTTVCLGASVQINADSLLSLSACNNIALNPDFSLVCAGDCYSILKFDANNYFVTTRQTVLKANGICNANWQNTNWTLGIVRSNTSLVGAIEKQGNRFFVAALDNGNFFSTNLGATFQGTGLTGFGCATPFIKTLPSGNTIMSMGGFLRGIYKISFQLNHKSLIINT